MLGQPSLVGSWAILQPYDGSGAGDTFVSKSGGCGTSLPWILDSLNKWHLLWLRSGLSYKCSGARSLVPSGGVEKVERSTGGA